MARTAQTARDPVPSIYEGLLQREYVDHQGNTVILGKWATESNFSNLEEVEDYRVQVYSTIPILTQPEALNNLYSYLCFNVPMPPFLEIYSYNPPDALACVEHQRREITHQKRLHAEQHECDEGKYLPPLIPTMQTPFSDDMSGFCFLLTSNSYLQATFAKDQDGTGPWWIYFDRNLPSAVKKLDILKSLQEPPTDFETFVDGYAFVNPDVRDINVSITNNQTGMIHDIYNLMHRRWSKYEYGQIDYGLHEPPPPASLDETSSLQHIQEILEQQQLASEVQSVDPNIFHLAWRSESRILTVTNNISDGQYDSDLQYVIYLSFLADIAENNHTMPTLLETTARTFTAGIVSHLPDSKTVYFEFRIPESSSLSSLLSAPSNDFHVGAIHRPEQNEQIRILPQSFGERTSPLAPHHFFTVVIDKPGFIQEPSVIFYTLWADPFEYIVPQASDPTVIETRRSASIQDTARMLGMVGFEEGILNGARKLTREEHMELLSLSPEEYDAKLQPFIDAASERKAEYERVDAEFEAMLASEE